MSDSRKVNHDTSYDSSLRFGMKSLLLAMFNICLFFGACMWAVRGPDAGTVIVFEWLAQGLAERQELGFVTGSIVAMPFVFLAGLVALTISMIRLGRRPYSAYHLVSFAVAAAVAVLTWLAGFGRAADIAVRLALPLAAAAVGMFVEVGYRKSPTPYWVLAAVGTLMATAYATFIIAVWAAGGKF